MESRWFGPAVDSMSAADGVLADLAPTDVQWETVLVPQDLGDGEGGGDARQDYGVADRSCPVLWLPLEPSQRRHSQLGDSTSEHPEVVYRHFAVIESVVSGHVGCMHLGDR
jgi:hypothetical protein